MGAVLDGWFPVLEGIDFLFQFLDGTVQTFDFRKPVLQQIPHKLPLVNNLQKAPHMPTLLQMRD